MYSFLRGGPAFGASQVSIRKVKIASSVSPSGRPAFGVMSIPASLYRCSEAESSRSFFGGCGSSARPRGAPATAAAARAGADSGGGLTSSAVADSSEDWPSAFSLNIRRLARSRAARRALSRKERTEPSCFELSVLRRAVELRRCVKANRADGSERRASASVMTAQCGGINKDGTPNNNKAKHEYSLTPFCSTINHGAPGHCHCGASDVFCVHRFSVIPSMDDEGPEQPSARVRR